MNKRKFQQGGQLTDTQQQGLQYLALMYAQQTGRDPQQDLEGFMQFVQQLAQQAGVQDIEQLLDMVYQQALGQAQAARRGAKLNYLKKLMGRCPEGQELMYFRAGGLICSKCVSKKKVLKEACGKKIKKNCGGKEMFQKGEKIVKDQEPAGPLRKNLYSQFTDWRKNRKKLYQRNSGQGGTSSIGGGGEPAYQTWRWEDAGDSYGTVMRTTKGYKIIDNVGKAFRRVKDTPIVLPYGYYGNNDTVYTPDGRTFDIQDNQEIPQSGQILVPAATTYLFLKDKYKNYSTKWPVHYDHPELHPGGNQRGGIR